MTLSRQTSKYNIAKIWPWQKEIQSRYWPTNTVIQREPSTAAQVLELTGNIFMVWTNYDLRG
jgi:hypothetical protein